MHIGVVFHPVLLFCDLLNALALFLVVNLVVLALDVLEEYAGFGQNVVEPGSGLLGMGPAVDHHVEPRWRRARFGWGGGDQGPGEVEDGLGQGGVARRSESTFLQ